MTVQKILAEHYASEIAALKAELDKAHRLCSQMVGWQRDSEIKNAKFKDQQDRAVALLSDLVARWADERGYDAAIQKARFFVREHKLRNATDEQARRALEGK